ncbi:hypothetical protein [Paenibacillus sp. GCM10027626]
MVINHPKHSIVPERKKGNIEYRIIVRFQMFADEHLQEMDEHKLKARTA